MVDTVISESASYSAPAEAEWHRRISQVAYHLAEKRQFATGHALDDWLAAEQIVRDQLVR